PLPRPPPDATSNPLINATIADNPHLFTLPTTLNVDRLEELTCTHPNRPFVLSILAGFREGFWPLATIPDSHPIISDNSIPPPKDPVHAQFLRDQRDLEISKGRWSSGFTELLNGMYASPSHAVEKDGGAGLRAVSNHSKEPHSPNSLVDKSIMPKVPLDGMKTLG
ncbi:hypothetical protein DFP72DRAFT_776973, partial [Ephemerocybe angulata]